jgi:hypothetical protein
MCVSQHGSKDKVTKESLKLVAIQHVDNKSVECTQLADPLSTTY